MPHTLPAFPSARGRATRTGRAGLDPPRKSEGAGPCGPAPSPVFRALNGSGARAQGSATAVGGVGRGRGRRGGVVHGGGFRVCGGGGGGGVTACGGGEQQGGEKGSADHDGSHNRGFAPARPPHSHGSGMSTRPYSIAPPAHVPHASRTGVDAIRTNPARGPHKQSRQRSVAFLRGQRREKHRNRLDMFIAPGRAKEDNFRILGDHGRLFFYLVAGVPDHLRSPRSARRRRITRLRAASKGPRAADLPVR